MILEHRCPIYEGEDIFQPPDLTDSRIEPWLDMLIERGIMDRNGLLLKSTAILRKGIGPEGYLFQIQCNE